MYGSDEGGALECIKCPEVIKLLISLGLLQKIV
jgi:hypothetical protein